MNGQGTRHGCIRIQERMGCPSNQMASQHMRSRKGITAHAEPYWDHPHLSLVVAELNDVSLLGRSRENMLPGSLAAESCCCCCCCCFELGSDHRSGSTKEDVRGATPPLSAARLSPFEGTVRRGAISTAEESRPFSVSSSSSRSSIKDVICWEGSMAV